MDRTNRLGTVGLVLLSLAALLALTAVRAPIPGAMPPREALLRSFQRLPLQFQPARDGSDAFVSAGPGYGMQVDGRSASIRLRKSAPGDGPAVTASVRMTLEGAAASAPVPEEQLPGKSHYLLGNDSRQWVRDVPSYRRLRCSDVYPGIDLVYYGNQERLEYDLLVAPGAEAERIRWRLEGAERVEVDASGDLVLHTAAGELRQHRPVVYQEREGRRQPVEGRYVLMASAQGSPIAGIRLGEYDATLPLVIDPVLTFSTYLGGSGSDSALAVAVDASGNAYVAGNTFSTDFAFTPGALQPEQGGPAARGDIFVTKFNPTGTALVYSTYVGGFGADEARGIAVDANGAAYVTGRTDSANFPTANALYSSSRGDADAFVFKLAPAGNELEYSTYLGGQGPDRGYGIAVDASGETVVTGFTASTNFPVANAAQPDPGSTPLFGDAFVTRLTAAGNSLVFSTYLGGNRGEMLAFGGVALDADGNAYVAGETASGDFPVTENALDPDLGGVPGTTDGFVTKFTPTGAVVYSTFLGGSGNDTITAIGVTADGEACVAGITVSADFPTVNAVRDAYSGDDDAFVAKLANDGTGLVYSTYLGGSGADRALALAVDAGGGVCVVGATFSTDFPIARPIQPPAGSYDAFVTRLNPLGTVLAFSTYFGGASQDFATGVAIDAMGEVYVAGYTLSSGFPVVFPLQPELGGTVDAFVARISEGAAPPVFPTGLAPVSICNTSVALSWTDNSDDEDAFEIERRTGAQPFAPVGAVAADVTTFEDGNLQPNTTYVYRVRATSQAGASAYSNEVMVTTLLTTVAAPSNLVVTTLDHTSLKLTWQDNSPDEAGFRVERSTDGVNYALIQTVGPDVVEFIDTDLESETEYAYRVRAASGGCDSAPTPPAIGVTAEVPIPAPTSLTAQALSESEIKLTWTDNSDNETGFRVERRVGDGFVEEAVLEANTVTYTDTGLAPTTAYSYRVVALRGERASAPTSEARATTFALPRGILKAPKKINFGKVRVGRTKNRVLKIRNRSRVDRMRLTIGDVTSPFSITGSGDHTVLIGGNRVVTISFTPTQPGKATARLVLTSSDPKRPHMEIRLTGKGR